MHCIVFIVAITPYVYSHKLVNQVYINFNTIDNALITVEVGYIIL